jgi:hypothetical protein
MSVIVIVLWKKYQEQLEHNKKLEETSRVVMEGLTRVIQSMETQNNRNSESIRIELESNYRRLKKSIDYVDDRLSNKIDRLYDTRH